MTRAWAIWLLPLVLALHNLEEGLFFPRYLPRVLEQLPPALRDWIGPVSPREMGVALVLATVIPLGFSVWAAGHDDVYCRFYSGSYGADTRIFTIRIPEDFADDMRQADHSHQLDLLLGLDRVQP